MKMFGLVMVAGLAACGGVVDDEAGRARGGQLGAGDADDGGIDRGAAGAAGAAGNPATGGGGAGSGSSSGNTADAGPAVVVDEALKVVVPAGFAAQCAATPQGVMKTPDLAAFQSAFLGAWLLCDVPSAFGTKDDVGLELTADGRWRKLLPSGDPTVLVRASGWGREGSWEIVDTAAMNGPGVFQLNLDVDGSGSIYVIPVFAETPQVMHLDNFGVFIADYVKLP